MATPAPGVSAANPGTYWGHAHQHYGSRDATRTGVGVEGTDPMNGFQLAGDPPLTRGAARDEIRYPASSYAHFGRGYDVPRLFFESMNKTLDLVKDGFIRRSILPTEVHLQGTTVKITREYYPVYVMRQHAEKTLPRMIKNEAAEDTAVMQRYAIGCISNDAFSNLAEGARRLRNYGTVIRNSVELTLNYNGITALMRQPTGSIAEAARLAGGKLNGPMQPDMLQDVVQLFGIFGKSNVALETIRNIVEQAMGSFGVKPTDIILPTGVIQYLNLQKQSIPFAVGGTEQLTRKDFVFQTTDGLSIREVDPFSHDNGSAAEHVMRRYACVGNYATLNPLWGLDTDGNYRSALAAIRIMNANTDRAEEITVEDCINNAPIWEKVASVAGFNGLDQTLFRVARGGPAGLTGARAGGANLVDDPVIRDPFVHTTGPKKGTLPQYIGEMPDRALTDDFVALAKRSVVRFMQKLAGPDLLLGAAYDIGAGAGDADFDLARTVIGGLNRFDGGNFATRKALNGAFGNRFLSLPTFGALLNAAGAALAGGGTDIVQMRAYLTDVFMRPDLTAAQKRNLRATAANAAFAAAAYNDFFAAAAKSDREAIEYVRNADAVTVIAPLYGHFTTVFAVVSIRTARPVAGRVPATAAAAAPVTVSATTEGAFRGVDIFSSTDDGDDGAAGRMPMEHLRRATTVGARALGTGVPIGLTGAMQPRGAAFSGFDPAGGSAIAQAFRIANWAGTMANGSSMYAAIERFALYWYLTLPITKQTFGFLAKNDIPLPKLAFNLLRRHEIFNMESVLVVAGGMQCGRTLMGPVHAAQGSDPRIMSSTAAVMMYTASVVTDPRRVQGIFDSIFRGYKSGRNNGFVAPSYNPKKLTRKDVENRARPSIEVVVTTSDDADRMSDVIAVNPQARFALFDGACDNGNVWNSDAAPAADYPWESCAGMAVARAGYGMTFQPETLNTLTTQWAPVGNLSGSFCFRDYQEARNPVSWKWEIRNQNTGHLGKQYPGVGVNYTGAMVPSRTSEAMGVVPVVLQ